MPQSNTEVAPYRENARGPQPQQHEVSLKFTPAQLQTAFEQGILLDLRIEVAWPGHLATPCGWRRTAAATASGRPPSSWRSPICARTGSPSPACSWPAPRRTSPGAPSPRARPYVCVHRAPRIDGCGPPRGDRGGHADSGWNATPRWWGRSPTVRFEQAPRGANRQLTGTLTLADRLPSGDYLLEVTARDLRAPAGRPDTASQSIDFTIR